MTLNMRDIQREQVLAVLHPAKPKPEKRAKKAANPPIDKEAILRGRGYVSPLCDCGCGKLGHDLHHVFIGRKKGFPILDDERNLVLVNHDEHISRRFDNLEWRKKFWVKQVRRYGLNQMAEWLKALPAKLEHRIDWL